MAPTIQTADKPRPPKPGERKSDLVCKVKYCNSLPDIPFDLKFITYPFDSTRFIQYNPTSLERNYRYEVLTEHDMGVTIDLIDKDAYTCEPGAQLDPADEKLLEEDVLTPQDSKRSRHHARNVSWLRRTEYISTEQTRFQPQTIDKAEAKVGYSIKRTLKDETLYMDRDSQIKAIEKTFEDSKLPITKHYSKPGVTPVEILPVYPDFIVWKYPCAQVIFDSDPAPVGKSCPAQIEEMSQAMIRGVMDESGEQFVAYFLPCEETLQKRKRDIEEKVPYMDDDEYEYKMAREYNWNVKSKASKGYEENYFLVMREDGIYYNELETRVRLSKRRQNKTGGPTINNTRLVVKHRPLNASEHRLQRFREKQLEPPGEEEEEDEPQEEDDEEEDIQKDDEQNDSDGSKKRRSRSRSKARSTRSNRSGESSRSSSGSRSGSRKSRSRSRDPQEEDDEEEYIQKDDEQNDSDGSKKRRSRSRSKARSTRSNRSGESSRSSSGSRSGSRKSRSRSRSRSKSGSGSRSGGSGSDGSKKRRSRSRSKARSTRSNRSRESSRSSSGSRSGSRSKSRSRKSRSRSRSRSKSGSGSGSGGSGSSSGGGSDSE